jgi:hypothetical protein
VTEEEFAMACEEGMARRDINRTVLDQILAVDDFLTFKVRAWKGRTQGQRKATYVCLRWTHVAGHVVRSMWGMGWDASCSVLM